MQGVLQERWLLGLPVVLGAGIVYFPLPTALLVLACLLTVGVYVVALRRPSLLVIEVPMSLLLLSTLVIRGRHHETIAENPLDSAGIFRITTVGLAALMTLIALLYSHRRALPSSFKLYGLYVLSVFLAAPLSVYPTLTAYRGLELLTGVLVVFAIWRRYGQEGIQRVGTLLFGFLVVSLVVVWAEVALLSGSLEPIPGSFLPYRIEGFFPAISANDVGLYGVTLFLWCLAKLTERSPRPWVLRLLALLGLVSLIGAQYRTGYVCAVVGLLIIGWFRRSYALILTLVAVACFVFLIRPQTIELTSDAQAIWQRGEAVGTVPTLAGRMAGWEASIPLWQESPVFGKGLLTATQFELVLSTGDPATLLNSWFEALVGTGIVGVSLLALSVLLLLRRSLGRCLPLVLLSVLLVRTLTGSAFEVFGFVALLYMYLALMPPTLPPSRYAPRDRLRQSSRLPVEPRRYWPR